MGNKGGGGRTGFGNATNKGPRALGGSRRAGGRVTGGSTGAALARAAGGNPRGKRISIAHFQRQTGAGNPMTEFDRLVREGKAEYTFLSDRVAAVLRNHGKSVPTRDGRPVRGIKVTGEIA